MNKLLIIYFFALIVFSIVLSNYFLNSTELFAPGFANLFGIGYMPSNDNCLIKGHTARHIAYSE